METSCWESLIQGKCFRFCVCFYLFSSTPKDTSAACIYSSHLFVDGDVFIRLLKGASFLQSVLKTVTQLSVSTKVLPWPAIAVPASFEDLILLHSISGGKPLIQRKGITAHMLSFTGNMTSSASQMVARASTAFKRSA